MNARQQEESLFDATRQLAGSAARRAFLDQNCAGQPAMRERVESLLSAETDADQFFTVASAATGEVAQHLVVEQEKSEAAQKSDDGSMLSEGLGTRIGNYKLLQKIGEGGCGVVYMAEQEKPIRRRVALKVIKLGMDTKSVIARFEAERQALAMMNDPNIACVLDAGATETGRPYFVMELVRGIKITDYCDQNHLDTRQRLDLFVQICTAIQHAHQKGIIHRDIKPSNILVTLRDGVPVPKVIDFGIAKAIEVRLTDKTLFTAYEQMIGTPAYMSPEQAEMSELDVDTRTDIYSLGVLLYELLTGRTPFDAKKLVQNGLDEMRRTLREQEPQRPSTMVTTLSGAELTAVASHHGVELPKLISLLRGDLDWIVMKSLEKDRRRRYETANGLAMDIERHLNDEPVVARPPSRLYRLQKLVRRNKIVFIASGAVALALIIGFGVSTRLYFQANASRQRAVEAERQAERARANEANMRREAETREKITQVRMLLNDEKYEDADKLISQLSITQPTVDGAVALRSLGEYYALQERWPEAADRFIALLKIDQLDGWETVTLDYLECGPALVEKGDTAGFERFRQSAIADFTHVKSPYADRIIKISLLLPANEEMMRELQPLAEVVWPTFTPKGEADTPVFLLAWRAVALALMEYRSGQYTRAIWYSDRCLKARERIAPRTAAAHIIHAMTQYKLGKTSEAALELAQAREMIESKYKNPLDRGSVSQGFWFDWTFARILLREATALIPPS